MNINRLKISARRRCSHELDIKAIRERAEKATPEPWALEGYHVLSDCPGWKEDDIAICRDELDTVFIAHARTDVPALCDEVERLRAAMREISNDPHCAYYEGPAISDSESCYRMGLSDGHRCASQKAREALGVDK